MDLKNQPRTVAFHTLGCKLNFSETSTIGRMFDEKGFDKVALSAKADVYVINTCSVTAHAEKKCRQTISKIRNIAPNAFIAVTGCYAQLNPEELALIPGVDLVLGAKEKFKLFDKVNDFTKKDTSNAPIYSCGIDEVDQFEVAYSEGERTRSFLKVQDGCDYFCSYCTIPLARGKSRNASIQDTLVKAHEVAAKGVKEIVLTGVNVGDFGVSTGEKFIDLLKELDKMDDIKRFRISSIEPNLLTDEIIEFCANSRSFLPHFHIPLQSGNDKILKLMRRRYTRDVFASRIHKCLEVRPDTFFGVDVIVGFPGETEEDFDDTYQFIESLPVSFLHVFPYSERPNTKTVNMEGKVSERELTRRTEALISLSDKKHRAFYEKHLGTVRKALFEQTTNKGRTIGYTENYIKVILNNPRFDLINKIVDVQLVSIDADGNVICELV